MAAGNTKFTPNFLRNCEALALKELEYKNKPPRNTLLYDSTIQNNFQTFEEDFQKKFSPFPAQGRTFKLQNVGLGHLRPKKKFLASQQFKFNDATQEIARGKVETCL